MFQKQVMRKYYLPTAPNSNNLTLGKVEKCKLKVCLIIVQKYDYKGLTFLKNYFPVSFDDFSWNKESNFPLVPLSF